MLYAPPDVCRALWRFDNRVRLAWHGEGQHFALLELARRNRLSPLRKIWNEPRWEGYVFSKNGRTTPDWDFWAYAPVDLGIEIPPLAVFGRGIIQTVRTQYARPASVLAYEDAVERGKAVNDIYESVGEEAGKRLWADAQAGRSGLHAPIGPADGPGQKYFAEASGEAAEQTKRQFLPEVSQKALEADQGPENDLGSISTR